MAQATAPRRATKTKSTAGRKKVGRPGLLDETKFTKEELEEYINKRGTLVKAAKDLGYSLRALKSATAKLGITRPAGRPYGTTTSYRTSPVAQWIREHKGTPLPHDYKKLSEMMGIPINVLYNFFGHQASRLKESLNRLGEMSKLKKTLKLQEGEKTIFIPCALMTEHVLHVRAFYLDVQVTLTFKATRERMVKFTLSPKLYRKIFNSPTSVETLEVKNMDFVS